MNAPRLPFRHTGIITVGPCLLTPRSPIMVPAAGFEPARPWQEILSPQRLPVPPRRHHDGRGKRTRTSDLTVPNGTLYHLSYTPSDHHSAAIDRASSFPSPSGLQWSERQDSNLRPPAPQAGALPGCATLRQCPRMMVGAAGFEPATLRSQTECATGLRYAPIIIRGFNADFPPASDPVGLRKGETNEKPRRS